MRYIKAWFTKAGVEELKCPDLNPTKHIWNKLKQNLCARSPHPTSVADLTNDLVAEMAQICIVTLQDLMESYPKIVEVIKTAKENYREYIELDVQ